MKSKTAFTLVEILVAIILVGLAVMSLVATNVALTRVNGAGINLSTAEFVLEHGMIDMVVERDEMKDTVSRLLKMLTSGIS